MHASALVPRGLLRRSPQRRFLLSGQGHPQRQFKRLAWLAPGCYDSQTLPQTIMDLFSLTGGKKIKVARRERVAFGMPICAEPCLGFLFPPGCTWIPSIIRKGLSSLCKWSALTLPSSIKWAFFLPPLKAQRSPLASAWGRDAVSHAWFRRRK